MQNLNIRQFVFSCLLVVYFVRKAVCIIAHNSDTATVVTVVSTHIEGVRD